MNVTETTTSNFGDARTVLSLLALLAYSGLLLTADDGTIGGLESAAAMAGCALLAFLFGSRALRIIAVAALAWAITYLVVAARQQRDERRGLSHETLRSLRELDAQIDGQPGRR